MVSGFIVCNNNPNYFYRLHRYEGQYLYLKSAKLGLICVILFTLISLLLNKYVPSYIPLCKGTFSLNVISWIKTLLGEAWPTEKTSELTSFSWIILVSIGSIIFAYLWSVIAKKILQLKARGSLEHSKVLLMSRILSDSPLDRLFFESYINIYPLLLTLESGKVYVGNISSLGEPTENEGMDQEISIIPILSGYRRKKDLRIKFTTSYKPVVSEIELIIRQNQIISATVFDFDAYLSFKNQKKDAKEILDK